MDKEQFRQTRKERMKQEFQIGDKVRLYSVHGDIVFDGKEAVIIEKALLVENEYYYGLYFEGEQFDKRDGKGKIVGKTSFYVPTWTDQLEKI